METHRPNRHHPVQICTISPKTCIEDQDRPPGSRTSPDDCHHRAV